MTTHLAQAAEALLPDLVAWRREFHRHPELAFEENRTSARVRAFLDSCGLDTRPCARTGVRGVLQGGEPGPTVALRADMDALPLEEEGDADYRSQVPGVMHACGHDGHMAILMGAARLLAAGRARLRGRVVFLFQPSEEHHPGGALPMIADGALDGVDALFGLHLWQPLPTGLVGIRPGAIMAESDTFRLTVSGRGGHASQPHLAVDPVLAAAHVVTAAQSIVSRGVDPLRAAVVSFTSVHGGQNHNIIPESVALRGTVRTFEADVQRAVKQRLQEVCEATCRAVGATAAFEYEDGYPAVVNTPALAERAAAAARDEFGDTRVAAVPPVMAGEDVGYFLQRVPGVFALLGAGDGRPFPHHSPRFDLDERALALGVRLMVRMAHELSPRL